MKKSFYLSTAITYTSATPHIGNVYEAILADAIVRYKRLEGFDVYFQTGTDEHGQKIQEKAQATGITPKAYVDDISSQVKSIYKRVGISYDRFIRTTDSDHEKIVQDIFKKLYDKNDIYKGKYEGLYCVPCESFFTDSQVVNGCCPDCGRPLTKASEEAYFLKLDKYQDRLVNFIKENPNFIQPESRKNEMLNNFLKDKLPDLCVSRTSFDWGIRVPFDEKHVIYVWLDALSNYITGLGYSVDGNSDERFNKYWPADVHLIGKDILRFHTIYWPIMLMALDIPLPKQIFGHPWILTGKDKMSKSKNNIIYTDDLIKYFGVDAVRYYVLHEIPFAQDGNITYELVIERFNTDLVNTLGNLVNRTIAMSIKYFDGEVTNTNVCTALDNELIYACYEAKNAVKKNMDALKVNDAVEAVFKLLRRANKYVDETEPWILGKDPERHPRLNTVLYNLIETIRFAAVLLQPFMPECSNKIFQQIKSNDTTLDSLENFGVYKGKQKLEKVDVLFQRIDVKEKLKEIELDMTVVSKVETKPEITIDDFEKIDIRIGEVKECAMHPKADRLLVSKIDIGGEIRQIVSGIASYYKPEEMIGKKVMVIVNLKPVELRGVLSEGMILVGSLDKDFEVITSEKLKAGSKVK